MQRHQLQLLGGCCQGLLLLTPAIALQHRDYHIPWIWLCAHQTRNVPKVGAVSAVYLPE